MAASVLEAIFARRSIRKFTDQTVDRKTVKILLEAGMAAPTATNCQPWEFVAVDDPGQLKKLKEAMPLGRYNAPLCIVVCGNPELARLPEIAKRFWVQDCSAAIENMLIAAVGLGLGSVWCGIHPITLLKNRVRQALDIPENVIPLGLLEFGYPAEEKPARTQYDEKRVHWQKYPNGKI